MLCRRLNLSAAGKDRRPFLRGTTGHLHPTLGHHGRGHWGGTPSRGTPVGPHWGIPPGLWVGGLYRSRYSCSTCSATAGVSPWRWPTWPEGRFATPGACKGRQCACNCVYVCAASHAHTWVCIGGNSTILGFATEGCLEICKHLLMFCKYSVLWGICFCCCYWFHMYNSPITA